MSKRYILCAGEQQKHPLTLPHSHVTSSHYDEELLPFFYSLLHLNAAVLYRGETL